VGKPIAKEPELRPVTIFPRKRKSPVDVVEEEEKIKSLYTWRCEMLGGFSLGVL